MRSIEGRVALVTGASRGIGRSIALELARAGALVALNYRSGQAEARELASEILALRQSTGAAVESGGSAHARALADEVEARVSTVAAVSGDDGGRVLTASDPVMQVRADVSVAQEARDLVRRVIEKWGRLDILVNNAGITRDRSLRNLGDEEWVAVINTNLNSAFFCTSAAVPTMIEQKYGRIVNVASVVGQAGNYGQANYAAAKGGMIAFTKSAALELARYNVTVNTVCPGFTATDMVRAIPEDIQAKIKAKIPLGRFAQPAEVARTVLFLVAEGDYITGQQINVNGGLYM